MLRRVAQGACIRDPACQDCLVFPREATAADVVERSQHAIRSARADGQAVGSPERALEFGIHASTEFLNAQVRFLNATKAKFL